MSNFQFEGPDGLPWIAYDSKDGYPYFRENNEVNYWTDSSFKKTFPDFNITDHAI